MDFNLTFGQSQSKRQQTTREDSLRLLLMGNFLGAAEHGPQTLIRLTLEGYEEALKGLKPSIRVGDETLHFESIEDFHPDALLKQSAQLRSLWEQYQSIETQGTASPHLTDVGSSAPAPGQGSAEATTSNPFEELLGESIKPGIPPDPQKHDPVDNLVRSALQGSEQISNQESDQVGKALNLLQAKLSAGLSEILHHHDFQALEARWRSLDRLIASIEDDAAVEIYLLPLNPSLINSWADAPDLAIEAIQGQIERIGGVHAIFLSHQFESSENEISLLRSLSELANALETPLITAVQSSMIGHDALPDHFGRSEAAQIGHAPWAQIKPTLKLDSLYLTVQRVLTRLPYGPKNDPIESFDYTEDAQSLTHEDFLWSDAALLIARLWLENFQETGSSMMPQAPRKVSDLPSYTFENELLSNTECWLSDEAAVVLESAKITPVKSNRYSTGISIFL